MRPIYTTMHTLVDGDEQENIHKYLYTHKKTNTDTTS